MNENQGVYKDFWRTVVAAGETWRGELTERRRDRSPLTVLETVTPVRDNGKIAHFVVVQEDVTERKEVEARAAHLAHHDPLTDLPNRLLFQDRLDQALARARRAQTLVAVVFLDLDRFKGVNDFYGHAFGDLVLRAAAQRTVGCIRESDTAARIGGDEFALVIPDLHEPQDAVTVTEKVVRSLSQPLVVEGKSVDVSASAGVALYPLDAIDPDRLIKAADAAVYRAKEGGGGVYRFFTTDMNAESARRTTLEKGLRHALDADRLFLEYQPQVDLETGRIVGAEALVRWQCNGTCVPPGDFIPVAELSGLILEIDDWVLRTACLQASAWQKTGVPIARMAVNVSARHLREQRLVDVVEEVLGSTGLPADALELELTESVVMRNVDEAVTTLRRLRDLGVHVAVDDFGTGYSSLSYLHTLPIDHLKIDRSFVRDLSPREDLGIVPAIIDMGHRLGLNVIAEGVETEPQAALLKKLGCDELQGFLYSPPVSADELLLLPEWNKSWSALKAEGWEEKSGEPAFLR